jgi:hypothetical protein
MSPPAARVEGDVTGERRTDTRLALVVPVFVKGFDEDGSAWEEMTNLGETSAGGASFTLRHPAAPGQVLHLSLPLPKKFRQYDLTELSYHVWGLVRHVKGVPEGQRVGVCFLGRKPPREFEKHPGGRYLLPSDPPPKPSDRRKVPRLDVFLNVRLARGPEGGGEPQEELTVAENLGRWGARVLTSLPVSKGEFVHVREVGGDYQSRAEIRNVYIGRDGIPRLNLRFELAVPARLVA